MFHIDRAASEVWQHILPHHAFQPEPLIPPVRVSLVAVRIRYLIEQLISVEVKVPFSPPGQLSALTGIGEYVDDRILGLLLIGC